MKIILMLLILQTFVGCAYGLRYIEKNKSSSKEWEKVEDPNQKK